MSPKRLPSTVLNCLKALLAMLLCAEACAAMSTEKVLHAFENNGDGAQPATPLIADEHGNLYGTTAGYYGNGAMCIDNNCGTAFEMSPPGGRGMAGPMSPFMCLPGRTAMVKRRPAL